MWALALMAAALAQTSVPVTPPQPDKLSYATSELNLFKLYDRDSYRAAFSAAAPTCDPSKLLKAWFDSTMSAVDPDSLALYKGVLTNKDGTAAVKQFWMTAGEAAVVNLPGRETYPKYVVAPTKAYLPASAQQQNNIPISPADLLTQDQAVMLAVELKGTVQPAWFAETVWPADESRRVYEIVVDGVAYNGGALLMNRYSSGVGAPGHWSKTADGEPTFVFDPPPDCAGVTSSQPVPVRDLLPNEILKDSPFGGWAVYRTDKQQQQAEAGGQFTPTDRALLQAIAKKLGVQ
ncbi:MAG: hypothetical protein ABSE56_12245 [Bryobacteraceae bacterium]